MFLRQNKVSAPIAISLPPFGVAFAESVHDQGFEMSPHSDAFYEIIYVLHGVIQYRDPQAQYSLPAGSFLPVRKLVRHEIRDLEPSTLLLLCLDAAFIESDREKQRLWSEIEAKRRKLIGVDATFRKRFEDWWRQAMVEQHGFRSGGPVALAAIASQILVSLARLPPHDPALSAMQRVRAVLSELEQTFYEDWNLDRAAARAGLSRRRFSEVFKQMAGVTFIERLTDLRLRHAAALLGQRKHTIATVAFSSGFGDLAHFYRVFRQRHQSSPLRWAGRHAARSQPKSSAGETRHQH